MKSSDATISAVFFICFRDGTFIYRIIARPRRVIKNPPMSWRVRRSRSFAGQKPEEAAQEHKRPFAGQVTRVRFGAVVHEVAERPEFFSCPCGRGVVVEAAGALGMPEDRLAIVVPCGHDAADETAFDPVEPCPGLTDIDELSPEPLKPVGKGLYQLKVIDRLPEMIDGEQVLLQR